MCAPLCSFLGWFLVRCRNKTPTSPGSTYPLFICYCFMLHPNMLQTPSHMLITPPCIFMSRLTPREDSKCKVAVCSVSLYHEGLFILFLRLWVPRWHHLHTLIRLHSICLLHMHQISCMSKCCRPNSTIMDILFVTMLPKNIRKKEGIPHCKGFYNCRITFSGNLFSHSHLELLSGHLLGPEESFLSYFPQGSVLTAHPLGSVV